MTAEIVLWNGFFKFPFRRLAILIHVLLFRKKG